MPDRDQVSKLKSNYDVVIVGAGNGGLGAALQLAMSGVKPLLLEQHNIPGGFATSFVRGRFEFDASLHQLANLGPEDNKGDLRRFLEEEAGLDIDYVAVPEAYRLVLTDENIDVRMPYGVDAFIDAMEKEEPGSGKPLREYLSLCRDVLDTLGLFGRMKGKINLNNIAGEVANIFKTSKRPIRELSDLVTKTMNFFKTVPYTVDEVTNTFGLSERAKTILYPYWCYLGPPTSRLSFTIWAAMLVSYLQRGGYVPKHRSQELTMAMEKKIRELGGHVEYNTRVEKILVKKGRIAGVETSAGDKIETEFMVSNASPTLVFNKLMYPKEEVPDIAHKFVNARQPGLTGLTLFLGLDASPEELGLEDYGYFVAPNMNTDEIYESFGQLGLTKMQATCCLNVANPDCSPPGTSTMYMTTLYTPECWEGVKPEEYTDVKNGIADAMIGQFEEGTGVKLRDHIEELEVATPATFARYTRTYNGIIYGYECEPWDSVMPRAMAANDEKYIKGLEFAGGFGFMCHGYNTSITSGVAAAGNIMKQMGGAK